MYINSDIISKNNVIIEWKYELERKKQKQIPQ